MLLHNTKHATHATVYLSDKHKRKFIKFDIAEFYPSISENLLNKSIAYAKSFTKIEGNAINAIKLARKSLLFSKDETWVKKGNDTLIDVTMGSFDGADVCELVGCYLLDYQLSSLIGRGNVGLHRDDGLAAINSSNEPVLYKTRKNIIALFKKEGLPIIIETNLFEMDFLYVTFNLATGKFFPFRKSINQSLYINAKPNHPQTIQRDLPNIINKRLLDLSCNEEEYEKAKPLYEPELNESDCKTTMTYTKITNVSNINRARNIIWFNLPYSQNVKTNIGKRFLKFVKKHFPRDHKLYKIFNRNTLALSYSCMSSISSVIKQHNYKVLSTTKNIDRLSNCRNKENCPLNGKCSQTCILYKADIITNKNSHIYYGESDGEFKSRYNNHSNSFRHRYHEQDAELSNYIWKLQGNCINFNVKWSVAAYVSR